jgi:hypothetical protein
MLFFYAFKKNVVLVLYICCEFSCCPFQRAPMPGMPGLPMGAPMVRPMVSSPVGLMGMNSGHIVQVYFYGILLILVHMV